jgi:hypothetical protein
MGVTRRVDSSTGFMLVVFLTHGCEIIRRRTLKQDEWICEMAGTPPSMSPAGAVLMLEGATRDGRVI